MQTITTKYHGPTDTKGSRISATCEAKRIYISYPYELSGSACHALAAKTLKDKMKWSGEMIGGDKKTGMVFVFTGDTKIS